MSQAKTEIAEKGRINVPIVDIQFGLTGTLVPVDHGYSLYSAISSLIPDLHDHDGVGIHPIPGYLAGNRLLAITDRSALTVRLPAELMTMVLPLAGKTLRIGESVLRVGLPYTRALVPSARVHSRLVVIKGFMEPGPFLEAAGRQLQGLGVDGKLHLIRQTRVAEANVDRRGGTHSPYLRRTLCIHGREVVGFALTIDELTAEESVRLQERGIGGRRRFGCGVFVPDRRRVSGEAGGAASH